MLIRTKQRMIHLTRMRSSIPNRSIPPNEMTTMAHTGRARPPQSSGHTDYDKNEEQYCTPNMYRSMWSPQWPRPQSIIIVNIITSSTVQEHSSSCDHHNGPHSMAGWTRTYRLYMTRCMSEFLATHTMTLNLAAHNDAVLPTVLICHSRRCWLEALTMSVSRDDNMS